MEPDFNRDINVDIPVTVAGAFGFYTTSSPLPELSSTASEGQPGREQVKSEIHYINVSPAIRLNHDRIPLDSLSVFSVVSKFMGQYPPEWNKHLRGIGQRGYNMVHFTPLMKRGDSNSPYSLYDQLQFDEKCFPNGENDIAELVSRMEKEYGLLSLTDVVWNHTANNSRIIKEHPEVGYNVETAPWLEAALELDDALLRYGNQLGKLGLPTEFKTVDDLLSVMEKMRPHVIDEIKLWEYYALNVERDTALTVDVWKSGNLAYPEGGFGEAGVGGLSQVRDWSLEEKVNFLRGKAVKNISQILGRYSREIDPKVGSAFLTALYGKYDASTTNSSEVETGFRKFLDVVNVSLFREYDDDVKEIFNQVYNRIKYLRIDEHGPRLGPVTENSPLIETYFTRLTSDETSKKQNPKALALVNNGWVWNADAMMDHAGPDSRAYLRREVIVWGDCVKLRYGQSHDDNPVLWDFMAKYSKLMAKYFVGFRIDNCHSTPLAVAEYLLDEARKVRPDLVVFAELFTGSEETDYVFAKRLGLTALIREAMQAWSSAELSRLVHRHGGRPIGSFDADLLCHKTHPKHDQVLSHIAYSPLHALFMDCTHDNETPAQKREARDTLPNAALVSMCASATGSVMGYDEIYPEHIDLVNETRLYASAFSNGAVDSPAGKGGIGGVKKLLNHLHTKMAVEKFDETHIHHEGEYITVHRVQPHTRKGILLIAHTAFTGSTGVGSLDPISLTGTKARALGAWKLVVGANEPRKGLDQDALLGLPSEVLDLPEANIATEGDNTVIRPPDEFPPGSITLLETWIPSTDSTENLSSFVTTGAEEAFQSVDAVGLNFTLYRCDAEERDSSKGARGVYTIPNHGPLVYAGLTGWWSVLEDIIKRNDLGHPLCSNLRDGQWAMDFLIARMSNAITQERYSQLRGVTEWLKSRFDAIRGLPDFLHPRYFTIIIKTAYDAAFKRGVRVLGSTVKGGQHFMDELAMVSIQQVGFVNSASLYPTKEVPCLAAGLPHFSTDWARCWGRDVFISLRGLLLSTGRFEEAKEHIIAFASVLKHGMIPNLLSNGKAPRYNSRDSVWFFLQAIQDYTEIVPDGIKILSEKVSRRFLPYDDTWFPFDDKRAYSQSSTVVEIIQEVFQRHASGMSFREYNAGPELDMQMSDAGFQMDINVDWKTGIIFGGNQWNCGTWMDKMGESPKAGNKGYPGTPRDGAAVEITGLLYSALAWTSRLAKSGMYPYKEVEIAEGQSISLEDWASRIKANFERCYYIPSDPAQDDQYDVDSSIINRRGIYKDLYRSGKPYEDYQLRPNFPVAMAVAPELFDPNKGFGALLVADKIIRGPTGMATLDPGDLNYRPYYNNSEDSTDFATSKGRNYHQGPEWLWPTGYFLRALMKFALMKGNTTPDRMDVFQQLARRLEACKEALRSSPWKGLTELTNKNGELCRDSVS